MRKFTRLMVTLDVLVATAIAGFLLLWGILAGLGMTNHPASLTTLLQQAGADRSVRLGLEGASAGLLLLHLLWLDAAVRHSRRGNIIALQKEDGSLIIAVSAVEDSLERVVKAQSGVRDVRVRVRVPRQPGQAAEVVLVASILDSEGILAVEERMRQAIRRRFQEILPQQDLRVSVRLRRFVADESPKPRRGEVERVYRGPEYPLEGY